MKALVGAFNQDKALVGAFSVIVKADGSFAALVVGVGNGLSPCGPVCPADQSDQIHHIWPASKCAGVQLRSVDITGVSAGK